MLGFYFTEQDLIEILNTVKDKMTSEQAALIANQLEWGQTTHRALDGIAHTGLTAIARDMLSKLLGIRATEILCTSDIEEQIRNVEGPLEETDARPGHEGVGPSQFGEILPQQPAAPQAAWLYPDHKQAVPTSLSPAPEAMSISSTPMSILSPAEMPPTQSRNKRPLSICSQTHPDSVRRSLAGQAPTLPLDTIRDIATETEHVPTWLDFFDIGYYAETHHLEDPMSSLGSQMPLPSTTRSPPRTSGMPPLMEYEHIE